MRVLLKLLDAGFEALYLLQKDTFNRFVYYVSYIFTALTTLNLVIGPGSSWPPFLLPLVRLLLYITFPVELLGLPAFGGFYILCIGFVCLGLISATAATLSRFLGEEGATWKAKVLRTSLGIVGERKRRSFFQEKIGGEEGENHPPYQERGEEKSRQSRYL